jgi:hypothetical protein
MSEPVAMGNFLTRLAGQARGAVPALAPRLPALFEPVSAALAPMADEAPATSRHLPPRVSREPAGDALLPGDGEDAPARGTPSPRRPRRVNPDTSPAAGTEARASVPAAVTTPATPRRRVRSTTGVPARAAASATVDGAPPAAHADAGAVMAAADNPPHRATVADMPTPDRSLVRTARTKPATAMSSVAPAPAASDRVRPSVAVDVQAWRAPGEGRHAAEPVIRVSIGRIEVRAVAVPAITVQQPERARPTRLDDYLQQRGRAR